MKPRLWILLAASALVACGDAAPEPATPPTPSVAARPGSSAAAPDEAFRKTAPAPGPEVVYVPPKIQEARLSNGIRVLLVERHELPIVAVELAVDRGAAQARPGVGGFVGGMLLAGTKTRSALALSDELEKLGASYSAWVGYDAGVVHGQCLTAKLGAMLTVLSDVLQNPAFAQDEIERERSRRLTALAQENDRPAALLANTIGTTLYPAAHPYAASVLGTEPALKQMKKADLTAFHSAHFAPETTTVAAAGDITKDALVVELERVLGGWKRKGKKVEPVVAPPPPGQSEARVIVVDRPGASQSNLAVALPGVPRVTKDFDALLMMNTILGGQFSSRLNMNLREKNAYTYGARSNFDMRQGPGPFSAGGAMFRDKTEPAIKEILTELERMRSGLVSEEELADAKANLIKQLPARFETAEDTAGTLTGLAVYGLPLDEFTTRPARLQRITREDVKRVAEAYLSPGQFRVVVVGDAAAFREGLKALPMGPLEVRPAPSSGGGAKPDGKPGASKSSDVPKKQDAPKKPDAAKKTDAPTKADAPKPQADKAGAKPATAAPK